jgi:alpha-amylase/alpha-mannosidase (GH57 family)
MPRPSAPDGARVALLLHMHQPDYRDPDDGVPVMPWVRLHAVRGYTDVPTLGRETGARFTMNVVPVLIDQLEQYAAGGTDRWEQLSRVRAEDLDAAERDFVRQRFVHGHPTMRRASPRYRELEARVEELDSPQELRDLQVWSNLAWMGVVARRRPEVRALIAQDRDFSHSQLLGLMDLQRELLRAVLPLWAEVSELSLTPYTHPILPLLVDFSHARRSQPHIPDEVDHRFPDDARRQLAEALERGRTAFGRTVRGMWPGEGSVSPESALLAAQAGVHWWATDQGVLERSHRDGPADVGRVWTVELGHHGHLSMVFRDRELSDRIGFVYADWDGRDAATDLLRRAGQNGVVPVILDGENPWESYPDSGEAFLTTLFASGRCLSIDDAIPRMPRGRIHHLHSGSWIDANYAIWAGDPMDRAGWRLLAELRRAWEAAGRPDAAWPSIRSAQGSDWFWWYGPEHHSDMHDLFDDLFRRHLAAGWRAMGQEPPASLSQPVWAALGKSG